MKRYFSLIAATVLLMCSCGEKTPDDEPVPGVLKSVVNTYYIGRNWKARWSLNNQRSIELFLKADKECRSPETDPNAYPELFLEIAERNGDRSFSFPFDFDPDFEFTTNIPIYSVCCADNFKSLRVVCPDSRWDARHAPGADLGDVMRVQYVSIAPYIRSGYKNLETLKTGKYVSQLSEQDLAVISPTIDLFFDALPDKGSYRLLITLTTTDDVEIVIPYTVEVG